MKKIFISYRRADAHETNRLSNALKNEYGHNNVFLDFDSLKPGNAWTEALESSLHEADALLVIISKNWLQMQDEESGRRRIDMEEDWVRKEIITFLKRKQAVPELLLLPLLINGAKMPAVKYLDEEINQLCDLQAIELNYSGNNIDFVPIKRRLEAADFSSIYPPLVVTPIGEPPPQRLTEAEEEQFVKQYKNWKIIEHEKPGYTGDSMRELYRLYEFASYEAAWKFLSKVDKVGIRPYNHHPRWQNTFNRVEMWLSTFNIGHKPSNRDLRLARIIEETWIKTTLGIK